MERRGFLGRLVGGGAAIALSKPALAKPALQSDVVEKSDARVWAKRAFSHLSEGMRDLGIKTDLVEIQPADRVQMLSTDFEKDPQRAAGQILRQMFYAGPSKVFIKSPGTYDWTSVSSQSLGLMIRVLSNSDGMTHQIVVLCG